MTDPTEAKTSSEDLSGGALANDFLRKLAHDIVAYASITRGAFEGLSSSISPDEQQSALLDLGGRGLAKLERLARRLRIVAMLEKQETIPLVSQDLRRILDGAVAEVQRLDARRNVKLTYEPGQGHMLVRAHEELLRAAFAELMSNAIRFARKQTIITLVEEAGSPCVVIEDDGPGFTPEFIAELLPPLRARKGQRGSGISLAGALFVAQAHSGAVQLSASSVGGGRVRFSLPCA